MPDVERVAPRDRWVLHFTHADNVAAIAMSGGLATRTVTAR
jgi:hypothetical protein